MPLKPHTAQQARAKRPAQILALLLAFVLAVGAGGVAMAGLTMPVVLAASSTTSAGTSLFDDLPDEIQIDAPSQRSVMLAADGSRIATFYADNRIVVPIEKISENIQNAVVSIEDRRFFDHKGVDPEGIARALVNNALHDDVEGASTLTQQYVKNALIERARVSGDDDAVHDAKKQEYSRKLREAKLAITLEKHATKQEILNGYLNIAPFGPSVYGVEAASLHYFSKHAADLTISEAALLAGITQSPARHDPIKHPESAANRRALVLAAMERDGHITAEERKEAAAQPVEELLNVQDMRQGCATAGTAAYFCESVIQQILTDKHFGKDADERRRLLYRGGLTIKTTLDPAKQKAAYDAAVSSVPVDDPSGISIAVNAVEPGTGKVLAMAQNSPYGDPTEANPHARKLNLSVGRDLAGGSGFHTGSTGKVFTLVEWLRSGRHLSDRVLTNRGEYMIKRDFQSCENLANTPYKVRNMELGPGGYSMSVLDATKHSVNRPYMDMTTKLNLCNIRKTANDLGALTLGNGKPLNALPAMTLGANELTPLSMANVGATMAAGGKRCTPVFLTEVTKPNGDAIEVPQISCEQTVEPNVINTAVYAMQQVISPTGTANRAILPGRPAAGKTGTANDNKHAWFVGFTPQLAASVWMGYADGDKSMSYQRINGEWTGMVFGGKIPAPTWKNFMQVALDGVPAAQFPAPDQSLVQGPQNPDERPSGDRSQTNERENRREERSSDRTEDAAVPGVVGYSQADATAVLRRAGFNVAVGEARSSEWQAGVIMGQSPSRAPRGATITIYPSSGPGD